MYEVETRNKSVVLQVSLYILLCMLFGLVCVCFSMKSLSVFKKSEKEGSSLRLLHSSVDLSDMQDRLEMKS